MQRLENRMQLENPLEMSSAGWAAEYGSQIPSNKAMEPPSTAISNGNFYSGLNSRDFTDFQIHQNGQQNSPRSLQYLTTKSPYGTVINPATGQYRHYRRFTQMGRASPQFGPLAQNLADARRNRAEIPHGKGKGRMVELDEHEWEKEFAQLDTNQQEDLDKQANEAMETELNQMDEDYVQEDSETNELGDFESIWRGIKSEHEAMQNLTAEEERLLDGDQPLRSFDTWDNFDGNFSSYPGDTNVGNYIFSDETPLFDSSPNPFEEGMNIISSKGNLSLAASAFEAAVQKDPSHIEAWVMLGTAQAQNEKETQAIRAFEHALRLDPSNLSALMGLAISYTNEGHEATAYRTLEKWLSVKYPQVLDPKDITPDMDVGFIERQELHNRVTDLYIRAAQLSPSGTSMDPDVQVGLGVLFYGAEEYAKAVDCFEAALASTEAGVVKEPYQAHLLWNRLGATLANSGRSEEAIAAYGEALAMNPNFVRAKYNLGVSCINIGCLQEAAQHLLGALSMHEVVKEKGVEKAREVGGDGSAKEAAEYGIGGLLGSANLIETLRRVFSSMGRRDLADKVETGVVDLDAFRGEFEF